MPRAAAVVVAAGEVRSEFTTRRSRTPAQFRLPAEQAGPEEPELGPDKQARRAEMVGRALSSAGTFASELLKQYERCRECVQSEQLDFW